MFGGLTIQSLQFSNSKVQPLDLLQGKHVNFTQEFDDLGLGRVHARIMAVAAAGNAEMKPARCEQNRELREPGIGVPTVSLAERQENWPIRLIPACKTFLATVVCAVK